MKKVKSDSLASEHIATQILFLRGEKVILDADLASLYQVDTKVLKQAVRRNIDRFPKDFMFILTNSEFSNLRSRIVTSSWGGQRYPPFAFTEQGVAMLSSILRSERAIKVNIAIMRTFATLRKWMQSNKDLESKIVQLEGKYDRQFKVVFDAIRQLIQEDTKERAPIGFKISRKRQANS